MDLRELGYFVAVFEERSVSAAARRSFVSQPSVSIALSNLEHELGTKLFARHRKGVTPTAAAERLYPMALRMADDAKALRTLFRKPDPKTPLVLGLMASLDIARTIELVAPLARDAELEVKLVTADEPCDARIVSRSLRKKHETFVPLWRERYVVALPAGHPLAAKSRLRATELAGERVVHRCHCELGPRFTSGKRRPKVVAIATSEEWAVALVSAGVGIAFLPEGVVRSNDRVAVRQLADVVASREVGVAYDARATLAPALERLLRGRGRLNA